MTQRIFDVENEKDMTDLWDILPDFIDKIIRNKPADYYLVHYKNNPNVDILRFIKINWHDKTEITRPIQEATEADIGKLCMFWEKTLSKQFVGLLGYVADVKAEDRYKRYQMLGGYWWSHARRLTKQEIEELI